MVSKHTNWRDRDLAKVGVGRWLIFPGIFGESINLTSRSRKKNRSWRLVLLKWRNQYQLQPISLAWVVVAEIPLSLNVISVQQSVNKSSWVTFWSRLVWLLDIHTDWTAGVWLPDSPHIILSSDDNYYSQPPPITTLGQSVSRVVLFS